jgi:Cof subfamily protein (haloacid dehalogenase superfamily)
MIPLLFEGVNKYAGNKRLFSTSVKERGIIIGSFGGFLMKNGNIRCLVFDIDGTLLDSGRKLSERNRSALLAAADSGAALALATGRPFGAVPRDIARLPGMTYAVTSNGAAICRLPGGKRVLEALMPPQTARAVINILSPYLARGDAACEVVTGGEAHCSAAYHASPEAFGAGRGGAEYIRATRRPEKDIEGYALGNIAAIDCINAVAARPELRAELLEKLRAGVRGASFITGGRLIEMAREGCGKAGAVSALLGMLGVAPEEAAAFGDGDSDAEMLAFAGSGVAVGAASEKCAAAARFTAIDPAQWIEENLSRFSTPAGFAVNNFEAKI